MYCNMYASGLLDAPNARCKVLFACNMANGKPQTTNVNLNAKASIVVIRAPTVPCPTKFKQCSKTPIAGSKQLERVNLEKISPLYPLISPNFSECMVPLKKQLAIQEEPAPRFLMYMVDVCSNRASRPSVVLASNTSLQPLK
jgi:hypothetical protein